MATTPTKPGSRKVLLVAGAVALLLVGYLFLRSRGSSATPAASPSGAQSSPVPQTDNSGNTQSSNDQQATADLLAALSGENQSLTKSFLDSVNGLVSLAGSSVGSPSSTAGAPSGFSSSSASSFATPDSAVTPITSLQGASETSLIPAATSQGASVTSSQGASQTSLISPPQTDPVTAATFISAGFTPQEAAAYFHPPASKMTYTTLSPSAAGPTKFYTYKADVPLGKGDTLGFTTGKGYYVKA